MVKVLKYLITNLISDNFKNIVYFIFEYLKNVINFEYNF